MNLECKGCAFTWTNRRGGDEFVKKGLDTALYSMEWRVAYPNVEVMALPAIGSNHSPLVLSISPKNERRRKIFRYEAFWIEDEECWCIMKRVWSNLEPLGRSIVEKLNLVAKELSEWSKKGFPNAQKRILWLKNELQTLMNSLEIHYDS